ncbi:MAG: 16S rRNA (cytidine(1402)-2'-O)-methyltransferase [Candidatus Dadabacteria bacterium]|nr:16S rRNA (cytidine(1402)-2'-O)-methyltransferase [Candidatus Dadabacteria bacterium]MYA49021.1 16S rRNA (cytidine(1402)-2'-O)-methyltransferase [Candidatus Dadabacteria bacterium]MYF47633.1 16S rRNA (cytidine(1402)-2'-O)-methyltransferase [Candidatus Dadabacteria bacterium]MYG82383.1 16S rRNA (cytidine(1402)-2'-O)-methyltransferase [Candidatus Dadabacteria bacterium]MYK49466.1 16S rRNA (cytidine(1402)-2'-O)-methyltransferase [Candidatus Dadabacteria bacterium]
MNGKLFLVSTPIGNLEDITFRAVTVLKDCDVIACEDTRNTRKLLARYGIETSLTSYHEHNEVEKLPKLLERLKDGKNVGLVSDAGTPSVSDPGWRLVNLLIENNIEVVPVPGPSALLSALVVSGLPTDSFLFLGFFPKTIGKKKELLKDVKPYPYTMVFYESPKRLPRTLSLMLEVLGDRNICVAREMTKLYEEVLRGSFSEVISVLSERETLKGEVTVVVEGSGEGQSEPSADAVQRMLRLLREKGFSLSEAASLASEAFGVSKNGIYRMALEIWNGDGSVG